MTEPRLLRWREMHALFNGSSALLVFVIDCLDEHWNAIPSDVRAMLETLQSTSGQDVRIFEVDFRVDPDFLSLFSTRPGPSVVRRLRGADTFDALEPGFTYGDLIEFCRVAFGEPKPTAQAPVPSRGHRLQAAAGEIVLTG